MFCPSCNSEFTEEHDYREQDISTNNWYNVWWCHQCNDPVVDLSLPLMYDEVHGEFIPVDPFQRGAVVRDERQPALPGF